MADIFVSWGSPDQAAVDNLLNRLSAIGLHFFDYRHDMLPGGEIPREVLQQIHDAKVALLCMSDQTVGREWLQRELHWCYADYVDEQRPMQRLIPVIVGSLSANVPRLLVDANLHRFDLSRPERLENDLERLTRAIQSELGEPPIVIPTTSLAISRDACERLFLDEERLVAMRDLCLAAGMHLDNDRAERFLARYGSTPEELKPFSPDKTIVEVVQDTIASLNHRREQGSPLAIHWYSAELLVEQSDEGRLARQHWQRDAHLLIIDALSLLDRNVVDHMQTIFALTRNDRRRALLWIPPYTHHTQRLEGLIRQVTETIVLLEAPFQDWVTRAERNVAFDTGTPVALVRWLDRALLDLASPPPPIEENVADLRRAFPQPRIDPSRMYKPPALGRQ